ncbi:hypothetical protein PDN14_29045 [Bacillus cereus group sp. Bc222]|uniref:hypothetical protein n=1 Tax=Bacillus cereus group sp. Bc222 TaxID=3018111 RepID=UPI0022E60452|nr:hypothetical protein [Bacillus cereus group sp. Bc222]MDA2242396.1 hypothetical protein [Bacillus cereus group sp. Bc222]
MFFYEAIWKLCDGNDESIGYTPYGVYYFYETLELVLERREVDLVRKYTTKQGVFELSVLPLKIYAEELISDGADIENQIVNERFVIEIINDSILNREELNLLSIIYENPDLSYERIAGMMGFKHHEQIRRVLKKINKKLNQYKKVSKK